MEEIKLSNDFTIYRKKFPKSFCDLNQYIIRANQVVQLKKTHPTDNKHFFYTTFQCREFDILNTVILDTCRVINGYKENNEWAIQNWIYLMTNKSENEIYHTHIDLIEGDGRIKTDWTFCFYVKIPTELDGDDGKIAFKTEDDVEHLFLPDEGDIFIFPPNLLHTPKLIKRATTDRIVIAGNVSLNPLSAIQNKSLL